MTTNMFLTLQMTRAVVWRGRSWEGSEGGSVEVGEGDDDEEEDGSDLVVLDPNHVSTECTLITTIMATSLL